MLMNALNVGQIPYAEFLAKVLPLFLKVKDSIKMTTLNNFFNKPLTTKYITIFDPVLIEAHKTITHDIYNIPKGYTLIDTLSYIFDNDVISMSEILQDYDDGIPSALNMVDVIRDGIKHNVLCLSCIKKQVKRVIK